VADFFVALLLHLCNPFTSSSSFGLAGARQQIDRSLLNLIEPEVPVRFSFLENVGPCIEKKPPFLGGFQRWRGRFRQEETCGNFTEGSERVGFLQTFGNFLLAIRLGLEY
jgi:hypothetical protein